MCSLQEGAIFSTLSPPLKGQGGDHIGQAESVHVHCFGDALGPHPLTAGATLWTAGPATRAAEAFLQWWVTHGSLGNVCWWAVTQDLLCSSFLGSSWGPMNLRWEVAD